LNTNQVAADMDRLAFRSIIYIRTNLKFFEFAFNIAIQF